MNKLLLLLFSVFLIGCQQPITAPTGVTHQIIIKNSLWQTVKTIQQTSSGKDAVSADIQAQLDAYNQTQTSDFERAYVDEAPPIDLSPTVTVYICNPENNNPNMVCYNIPRQSLVDNWAGWKDDAQGQVLYVDHIPPAPILDKNVNPYAYYAIYVVNTLPGGNQVVVHEDHCGYSADQSWNPAGISDWPNVDAYFGSMISSWNNQITIDNANGANNERMITRQIFVVPVLNP